MTAYAAQRLGALGLGPEPELEDLVDRRHGRELVGAARRGGNSKGQAEARPSHFVLPFARRRNSLLTGGPQIPIG